MVTIYTDTHRYACLDTPEITDQDIQIYDDYINQYFVYVVEKAEEKGFNIEFSSELGGRSYSVGDDEPDKREAAHNFMLFEIKDFWLWYN